MTDDMMGLDLDLQIDQLGEEAKLIAKKKKELLEKRNKQFCDLIKNEVINELEKKYDFKGYRKNMGEFCNKFDEFLVDFEKNIDTNTKETKKALKEKIPPLREFTEFIKKFNEG
ncbi:MAG: hypothetical protein FIB07_11825 [Candidatus Methanoperedens sp.]|nr:hypothetical protein [Candidatus Methanoperedens sp.]